MNSNPAVAEILLDYQIKSIQREIDVLNAEREKQRLDCIPKERDLIDEISQCWAFQDPPQFQEDSSEGKRVKEIQDWIDCFLMTYGRKLKALQESWEAYESEYCREKIRLEKKLRPFIKVLEQLRQSRNADLLV